MGVRGAARTTVEKHAVVVQRVDVQHRHGRRGRAGGRAIGAGHGGDGLEGVGHLAGQPVREHAAVGHALGKDASRVDVQALAQIGHHGTHEAHVIDLPVARLAAAQAGVPGGELARAQAAGAVGKHHHVASLLGVRDQPVITVVGLDVHVAATPMERQHHRHRCGRVVARRHMHAVLARQATVAQAEPVLAGPGDRHRCGRLRRPVLALLQPVAQAWALGALLRAGRRWRQPGPQDQQ